MEESKSKEFRNKYKVIEETCNKNENEQDKDKSKEFKDNFLDNSKLIISKLKTR